MKLISANSFFFLLLLRHRRLLHQVRPEQSTIGRDTSKADYSRGFSGLCFHSYTSNSSWPLYDHLSSVRRSTRPFMLYLVEHTICFVFSLEQPLLTALPAVRIALNSPSSKNNKTKNYLRELRTQDDSKRVSDMIHRLTTWSPRPSSECKTMFWRFRGTD